MVFALVIVIPVVVIAVWAFFRFSPAHADQKRVFLFNVASLLVTLAAAAGWTLRTYLVMSSTVDGAWWPIISFLGILVLITLVLALAGFMRNFIVFRRRLGGTRL